MELLTAKQARQISAKTTDNTIVKNNVEYILKKIIKEANKGEFHIYINNSELEGNVNVEKLTMEQMQELGYNVYLNSFIYKITW